MDIPKPETWQNSFELFGRIVTFDQTFSNDGPGEGFAWWHDEADEVELKYHYLDIAPDAYGERIEVWDYRDGATTQWVFQRAQVGWQLITSGLSPEVIAAVPSWDVGPEKFPNVRGAQNEKFASEIRDAVKAAMEADPYYFNIPILNERIQDADAKIDEVVAMTGGLIIILTTPKLGGVLPNVPGANFSDVKVVARVIESLILNDTGKASLDVAIYTAAFFAQTQFDSLPSPLKLDEPGVLLGNDPRGVNWDAQARTEGGTKLVIPRLEDLTIDAGDLDAIALAQATPGAAIFYTTDLSYPAPRNPAAHLFLAPFSSPSGSTIRARAWLSGYLPSAELKQQLA